VKGTDVPAPELVSYLNPLDLLRRFAPTPLKAQVHFECANVLLETNDLSLLLSLPVPRSSASSPSSQTCLWKLVRDVDARSKPTEAAIVMAGSLIVYSMGPACLIGADRERKQILAFIGMDVDARIFQESILPSLCRLTEFVMRPPEISEAVPNAEVAIGDRCNA
jgi:hypothetical protein